MDEFDLEDMRLDTYLEEKEYIDFLLSPLPWNELPTLGEWLY